MTGGRTFIWPFLEQYEILSLEPVGTDYSFDNIQTAEGRPISLNGKIQFRIKNDEGSIRQAALYLLSKGEAEKAAVALGIVESNLRRMVEESGREAIERGPMKFGDRVIETAAPQLG